MRAPLRRSGPGPHEAEPGLGRLGRGGRGRLGLPRPGGKLRGAQGANGPLVFEFAAVRVWAVRHREAPARRSGCWSGGRWRRTPEIKYYVSNADASTPLDVLAGVACTRHQVEDFFEDAKSYLGMAQYETRSWVGWHHHMTLVGLAHLFITITKLTLRRETPELTLDMTVRLLRATFKLPIWTRSTHCACWNITWGEIASPHAHMRHMDGPQAERETPSAVELDTFRTGGFPHHRGCSRSGPLCQRKRRGISGIGRLSECPSHSFVRSRLHQLSAL